LLVCAQLTLLAACAQQPPAPARDVAVSPSLPEMIYRDAARNGAAVYRVDTQRSLVLIHVGRAGVMQNLGHEHVIASQDLDGLVLVSDDPATSRADLRLPLPSLIVDQAEFRILFGLEAEVPASAAEGTTRNMQDKVLESAAYPWLDVGVQFASVHDRPPSFSVSITLHGTSFEYVVPVQLEIRPEQLTAAGRMSVRHSDFGLTPFSAAGGLVRVADEINLEFEIVATRIKMGSE